MFESVRPDPGPDALVRASRIFYVLTAIGVLSIILGGVQTVAQWAYHGASWFVIHSLWTAGCYVTARAIDEQRRWAKWVAIALAIVSLINIPVGTVIGIAVLVYVNRASKAGLFAH